VRVGWLLLCPVVVLADPVVTNQRAEVPITRPVPPAHMLFVISSSNDVVVLGFPYDVHEREEYDLVGRNGVLGRIRVSTVQLTTEDCPAHAYALGHSELLSGDAKSVPRDYQTVVAVGPSVGAPRKAARMIDPAEAAPESLPPPGALPTLVQLADLDGDGAPELARYVYDCDGGVNARIPTNELCIQDWTRERGSWIVATDARISCHDK
jgi:hypothetical protein